MIGAIFAGLVCLAFLFWIVELLRAAIARRPTSWQQWAAARRDEPGATTPRSANVTPLANTFWGAGIRTPDMDLSPEQRRTMWRMLVGITAPIVAVAVAAVIVGADVGVGWGFITAAVGAVVVTALLALIMPRLPSIRRYNAELTSNKTQPRKTPRPKPL